MRELIKLAVSLEVSERRYNNKSKTQTNEWTAGKEGFDENKKNNWLEINSRSYKSESESLKKMRMEWKYAQISQVVAAAWVVRSRRQDRFLLPLI